MTDMAGSSDSGQEPTPAPSAPSSDDTAAFQRFYLNEQSAPGAASQHGLLYRIFVGWWKK